MFGFIKQWFKDREICSNLMILMRARVNQPGGEQALLNVLEEMDEDLKSDTIDPGYARRIALVYPKLIALYKEKFINQA